MSESEVGWGRHVAAMAVIAATGVAVIYIPQPIQPLVAEEFGLSGASASAATIAVQAGYALGVVLLVSLGDRFSARRQVTTQVIVTAGTLVIAALSPAYVVFVALSFIAGTTATVGQILVSAALRLAPPAGRARTAAVLLGAFVVGLFVVRTSLGAVAEAIGWRGAVLACAVLVIALVPVSLRFSPADAPTEPPPYARILGSIPRIASSSVTLQLMTAVHVLCFMAFISLWSMSTIYAVNQLGLTVAQAALMGIAGLAGGMITIVSAPLHARVGARRSLVLCIGSVIVGTVLVAAGTETLPLVLLGLLLVSAGMSSEQVSTQPIALASVAPEENGRANTVFMAATFFGGTVATALGSVLTSTGGYAAVGVMGASCASAAALLAVLANKRGMLERSAR